MGIETKTIEIDNRRVAITQFPARKSLRLLLKTVKLIEDPIVLSNNNGIALLEIMADKLASINVNEVLIEILAETSIDNVKINSENYDYIFGDFALLLEVFKETALYNWQIYYDRQDDISYLYKKEVYMDKVSVDILAKALSKEWLIWRLVTKGVSLKDLETHFSAADVIDANLAFEVDDAILDSNTVARLRAI